jgi:hypothetical protein
MKENSMKMVEYQHRCEGGGNMVALDCSSGWQHGELVLIVPKIEFRELIEKLNLILPEMIPGVKNIAFPHIKELNEVMLEVERCGHLLKKMG